MGQLVGVPWLDWTCGQCDDCTGGRENLCTRARFTGWQLAGGYAQYALADARYVFALPPAYEDAQAAPLLCAGMIGWHAYVKAGIAARRLGRYGFGAAAHLVAQSALDRGTQMCAFTRAGDEPAKALARELGVLWTGDSLSPTPWPLDVAILFAPDRALVPAALAAVRPGGTVVCAGIHMSDIATFP